ncbi:hypothetical protein SLH49_14990 [Cognatiyoonia sp. IB215446]|uniref:hypothetical protein n=1 Tax=Cognatiyoonia sp. IB215446 TaxID=3097355 RepID=UPI002A0B5BA9|nr:hypothetical protein [Cognatiyoonia sp. IB215446]MDX8349291.1 hypothetical protein [Cognatiyoonia sp. IB215446]
MRTFVYIPWIEAHGDVLLRDVFGQDPELSLIPLRLTPKGDSASRRALFHFALRHPRTYARLFERQLLQLDQPVHGMVLTLDWAAPMRIAVEVAQSHGMPVILLPHEGAFMDERRFYRDPFSGINCSIADRFLAWGNLQKDIMVKRGFPPEKISIVSSPKLQKAANYTPRLSRDAYCHRLGLNKDQKIVMFCAQTLDNVTDTKQARLRQADAVFDLYNACRRADCQLLVRLPPVQHESILQRQLKKMISTDLPVFVRPGSGDEAIDPHEATWHADCVTSISSTMLLEKGLMNGPSFAFSYLTENSPFVERGQLPVVKNKDEVYPLLCKLLAEGHRSFPKQGWRQLERDFSNGDFTATNAISDIAQIFRSYEDVFVPIDKEPNTNGGFVFANSARRLHSAIFKTLIAIHIPYRNRLAQILFPKLP